MIFLGIVDGEGAGLKILMKKRAKVFIVKMSGVTIKRENVSKLLSFHSEILIVRTNSKEAVQ